MNAPIGGAESAAARWKLMAGISGSQRSQPADGNQGWLEDRSADPGQRSVGARGESMPGLQDSVE